MNIAPPTTTLTSQAETSALRYEAATLGGELRVALLAVISGWRVIAGTTAAAVLLAIAYVMLTPQLYTARTELLLQPREGEIVAGKVVDTGLGTSAVGADTLSLDSQIQVMTSDSVIRELIENEDIKTDEEFVKPPSALGSFIAGVKLWLRGSAPLPSSASLDPTYDAAREALLDKLRVKRLPNTYVIGIEFKSEDPVKAARIANALARLYVEEVSNAAAGVTKEAAEALQSRLITLGAVANADSVAVEAYRRETGLTDTGSGLIVEQQLRDINNQLSLARVAKIEAQANLARVRRAMELSSTAGLDATLLQSPLIAELQTAQTRLQGEEARVRATFLPGHPRAADLADRKAALAASMRTEFRRIMDRLQLEYQIAADKEKNLTAEVAALEADNADMNEASVRLRELMRAAAASEAVYNTFLTRSKEIWEQVGLPNSNARVISEAFPPSRPSEPRATILGLASLVLGLGIGVFVVWMRHILRSPPRLHAILESHTLGGSRELPQHAP